MVGPIVTGKLLDRFDVLAKLKSYRLTELSFQFPALAI